MKKSPAFMNELKLLRQFFNKNTLETKFFSLAILFWSLIIISTLSAYYLGDALNLLDTKILSSIYATRTNFSDHFFIIITNLAEPAVGVITILFFVVLLAIEKRKYFSTTIFFSFFAGEGFAYILKKIIERPRPDELMQLIKETSFSLPSGHATTSAIVFGFIGYLFIKNSKSKKMNYLITTLVLLSVILIDYSRLYLGVHYPSDVLSGNAIGFLSLFLMIGISEWFIISKREQSQFLTSTKIYIGLTVLLVASISFYLL